MQSEAIHARQLAQLKLLKQILDDEGVPTNLLERSEEVPIQLLMAGVQPDGAGRDRILQFSFLPLDEDEVQAVQLLQIYHRLPFTLQEGCRGELASLLLDINARLPLGHFGLSHQNEIYYRHVYTLSGAKSYEAEEMLDVLSLYVYMLEMFGGIVEGVANGTMDAASAVEHLS